MGRPGKGGVRTNEINEIEVITNKINISDEIKIITDSLYKIDTYDSNISNYYSIIDKKLDFWDHVIELDKLNIAQIYRVFRERKRLRRIRRKIKNDLELINTFNKHRQKLLHPASINSLSMEMGKIQSIINKRQYGYSEYTDEELIEILGEDFRKGN